MREGEEVARLERRRQRRSNLDDAALRADADPPLLTLKTKLGNGSSVTASFCGGPGITTTGAMVSTRNGWLTTTLWLPAASSALTSSVWKPSARALGTTNAPVHDAKEPASILHSLVTGEPPGGVMVQLNPGVLSEVTLGLAGDRSTSGGTVSTMKACVASGPTLPASSVGSIWTT